MWFLWGFLSFFLCHIALNVFLVFADKYRQKKEGMDLYVAIGVVVFWIGWIIFGINVIGDTTAILVGNAIGFVSGGLHFYVRKRTEYLEGILKKNREEQIKGEVEALTSALAGGAFAQQNRVNNTITNNSFNEQNVVNVEVQLETFPQLYFDDPDNKMAKAIETENYKFIQDVYKILHQNALENNDEDCESALLNVDFVLDGEKGWKLAFLECLAEKRDDCFYIILALSDDCKIKRYLVAMRTSGKTNQFGYGVGEFGEINPDTTNIMYGETSTNYFDVVDSMKLALAKPNPKANRISAITLQQKRAWMQSHLQKQSRKQNNFQLPS